MHVSFLVPVYNVEKYLEKCIESLLIQKGCPYEIVLLDDGSTDSSGAICDRYATQYPNIRVIHKENEGLLMTRRRGFAEARGDWFICVDSDDYVAPTLLERVVQSVQETKPDMVLYNFEYFNAQGIHMPSRLQLNDGELLEGDGKDKIYQKRLLSVDVNMMWMRAVKREIVDLDADYSDCGIRNMCEDALQMLPLYTNAQRIACINEPLYYYRKGDDSITARTTMDSWRSSQVLFGHTQKYLEIWNVSDEVKLKFYTKHLEHLSNYIRWLFSVDARELPAPLPEMIARLKKTPDYIVSRQNYRREYAGSTYLSLLTPALSHGVEKENLMLIRAVLGLETWMLSLKNHISKFGKRR